MQPAAWETPDERVPPVGVGVELGLRLNEIVGQIGGRSAQEVFYSFLFYNLFSFLFFQVHFEFRIWIQTSNFILNYFIKFKSTNSENIISLYIIYSPFSFPPISFNSSPHYHYYIFIHLLLLYEMHKQNSNMMQWFICVLVRIYSFLNMISHMFQWWMANHIRKSTLL